MREMTGQQASLIVTAIAHEHARELTKMGALLDEAVLRGERPSYAPPPKPASASTTSSRPSSSSPAELRGRAGRLALPAPSPRWL
ncbi:hypothetical protein COW64_08410 [bacterium (Candidatus Blackallbacteria) CG18_big_fil_WC_8_21_14_2_50_49_26]|nr:MAG: hypothetical protein COW64_08410 [bacterium (Candidatus Blackallbacteria) CG18_big_fil_WC_8_21_14_2_50_49_26]